MSEFTVTIVSRPEIDCAGIKVATTMEKAAVDCPALWQAFGPRMCSFPANPEFADQSFGASIMTSAQDFDYWAVMPLAPGAEIPEGMERLVLPAGEYATCEVGSLEKLGAAYTYIYGEWIQQEKGHVLEMCGVGYEGYTSDFEKTGTLLIYCPLKAK